MHPLKNLPLKNLRANDGYNLIQMAIAMLVLGLLVGPFANIYMLDKKEQKIKTTRSNLDAITFAIQNYKEAYGAYPRPAPMAILPNNPAYGHVITPALMAAVAPGTCGTNASSVCVQTSTRAALTNKRVISGSIPFRLLQVDESVSIDGYGSKFVYTVTEDLTSTATFNDKNGGIDIQDQSKSLTDPPGSASFLVVSPGPDRIGSYSVGGLLQNPCVGVGKDIRNCHIGFQTGIETNLFATYASTLENDAAGINHFDDIVSYYTKAIDPLWRRTEANFDNIQDIVSGPIGVGTTTPAVKLDISSSSMNPPTPSIIAYGSNGADGKIIAEKICDVTGTKCFDPVRIGGNNTMTGKGIKCPANTFMSGINGLSTNNADCNALDTLGVRCDYINPAKPVLLSINADKSLNCGPRPNPSCAGEVKNLCTRNDVALVGALDGATQSFSRGSCKTITYKCSSGSWNIESQAGQCNFTASVTTTGMSCAFGYTGAPTTTTTTLCLGGSTSVNNVAQACTCVGATSVTYPQCNTLPGFGNYTGTAIVTTRATPPACNTTTTTDTSGCTCKIPNPLVTSIPAGNCGANQVGTITQPVIFNPAPGVCAYVNNGPVVNTCRCNTPNPSTRTVTSNTCPSGYNGSVSQYQVYNSTVGVCAWQDSGLPTSNCVCDATTTTRTADHQCTDTSCNVPDSGNPDIFTTTVNPATCVRTETLTTVGSCKSKNFVWKAITGSTPGSGTPSNPIFIGETSCTCAEYNDQNIKKFCYQQGDSSFARYQCSCKL